MNDVNWEIVVRVMGIVLTGVLGIWLASVIVVRYRYFRAHRYVGFGFLLRFDEEGPIIMTRLLQSPAGRARIAIGDRLIAWEGVSLQFATAEEFTKWFVMHPPQMGETRTYTLARAKSDERYDATMTAQWIQGPIPMYYPPANHIRTDPNRKHGIAVCCKTGQLIETASLRDTSVKQVLE